MSLLHILMAYLRSRWQTRPGRNRAQFLAWQGRQLRHWHRRRLPEVAYYADHSGPLPITDKALMMARFAEFNTAGISADQAWAAIADTRQIGNLTVGASTGTSGNRGLFVISDAERYQWLGVLLAKALPDVWRKHRVAVILPLHTALYDSARHSRIDLRFHNLNLGLEALLPGLADQMPDVIVAPPKVLVWLAQQATLLRPQRLFAAAETLDPPDRVRIEAGFGVKLGQIYMATEGLLGVTCAQGTLHLAEDVVHFEWEPFGDLVTPLISGFTRTTQILSRYRMNDLLRLAPSPCPCGSPLQAVDEIVGRADDSFRFAENLLLTPDILRNAVLNADRRITDFRLHQISEAHLRLILPPDLPPECTLAAQDALLGLLARHGLTARIETLSAPLAPDPSRKLRRITRMVPDG